jgi:predicted transcriptional regulator
MAEEDIESNNSLLSRAWDGLKGYVSGISTKIKLIIGTVAGIFAIIIYFIIKKEMNEKEILELELNKLETEIKVKLKQEDVDKNSSEIISLEEEKKKIIEKIKDIKNEDLSKENDLDEFFDDRGF